MFGAGSGSADVDLPTGLQEGDVLIAAIVCDQGLGSDFTQANPGWIEILDAGGSGPGHEVAVKQMSSTPDSTASLTRNSGKVHAYLFQAFRGADNSVALDNGSNAANGSSGMPNPPSHTPLTDGALIVAIGLVDDIDASTASAMTGYSNFLHQGGEASPGASCGVMIASKTLATAAAENPGAFAGSDSETWRAVTFSLRPGDDVGQSLTAPAIATTPSLFAPVVQPGGVALSAPLIGDTTTIHSADIEVQPVELVAPNISSGAILSLPAVEPQAANLIAGEIAASENLHAATVDPQAINLSSPKIIASEQHHAPEIAPLAVMLSPATLPASAAVHASTLEAGAVTLTAGFIDHNEQVPAPLISAGQLNIVAPLLAQSSSVYSAAVQPGTVSIACSLVGPSSAIFGPIVGSEKALAAPVISSVEVGHPPVIAAGPVTVAADFISEVDQFFEATLAASIVIQAPHVESGASIQSAAIETLTNLAAPLLESMDLTHGAEIHPDNINLLAPILDSESVVFPATAFLSDNQIIQQVPVTLELNRSSGLTLRLDRSRNVSSGLNKSSSINLDWKM